MVEDPNLMLENGDSRASAERLYAVNPEHQRRAAELLGNGGIAVLPFNGIFGIFGDIEDPAISDRIMQVKNRPHDKKLVAVTAPEHLGELVDFTRLDNGITHDQIIALQTRLHALGVILPAAASAPSHLVDRDGAATVLSIWTEYTPFRNVFEHFRSDFGGKAFVGTSANKSGEPTHRYMNEVYRTFKTDVDAMLLADFSHLPEIRGMSTSVVDFTGSKPRLDREGNVMIDEINSELRRLDLPELLIDERRKKVQQRV